MQIDSITQVINHFHLNPGEHNELKKQLRQIQKKIHPDTNGGDFSSEYEKSQFHDVEEAIKFIDNSKNNVILSNKEKDAAVDLVSTIKEFLVPAITESAQQNVEQSAISKLDRCLEHIRTPLGVPRVALSALSAAVTSVWAFPGVVSTHPVLGKLLKVSSVRFSYFWLSLLLITVLVWVRSWYQEGKHKGIVSALRTEHYQNDIFIGFMENIRYRPGSISFSKDDLIHYIRFPTIKYEFYKQPFRQVLNRQLFNRLSIPPIDLEPAECAAELILRRLLKRHVIQLTASRGLSDVYEVPNFESSEWPHP